MKRLYYGELLRHIRYLDGSMLNGKPDKWYVRLPAPDLPPEPGKKRLPRVNTFENDTLPGLLADIKAAGYPVWGNDVLDYVYPYSAWDKLVMDELETLRERVRELEAEDTTP